LPSLCDVIRLNIAANAAKVGMKMKLNGAQIVAKQLIAHGITTVFGYPGGQVLPLYDELYRNADKINHILTADEQGAAHAADGWARASGKTGVVIATSGPGATNLVTGIATAYLDSVPLVAITGNVPVSMLGKDSFQEVDIVGITQPVVKHSFAVWNVKNLEHTLNEAFRVANSGRKGPVLVDIPRNVQVDTCEYIGQPFAQKTKTPYSFDAKQLADVINNSKKPFIYAGGGVIASGAQEQLRELSEKLSAPVGFSMMGLTALPHDYGLNLGMCGMHGKYAATVAKSECDVMIALGVRFSDRATGNVDAFQEDKIIIHVDIDLAEIGKNVPSVITACGDIKEILTDLLPKISVSCNDEWISRIEELKHIQQEPQNEKFTPKNIIETVEEILDKDILIATDVGQHQMWVMQYYKFQKPQTLLTSGGLGTMGYGLGAAIGGCLAMNKKRTVLFTGDGSFGMNLNELVTAVSNETPLVIVLLNNGVLGMVRQWQNMFYDHRYSQTTLNRKTNFAALAEAFGAHGHTVDNLSQFKEILGNLPENIPVVIDCRICMDEKVFPMIPPGGTVKDIVIREKE
jgi:acetolactate synthase-1/2/3 large subunit